MYQEASTALDGREAKIEEVANMIETDLYLLGATAVEDKLQDKVIFDFLSKKKICILYNYVEIEKSFNSTIKFKKINILQLTYKYQRINEE